MSAQLKPVHKLLMKEDRTAAVALSQHIRTLALARRRLWPRLHLEMVGKGKQSHVQPAARCRETASARGYVHRRYVQYSARV